MLATGAAGGTLFEFECYDTSHLLHPGAISSTAASIPVRRWVQTVFGLLGGIGADPEDVTHMRRTATRLLGEDYVWSVLGAGASQMRIAAMSVAMGGHVRVGLEDSLWLGPGRLATSSAEQVELIKGVLAANRLQPRKPRGGARDAGAQGRGTR